VEDTIGLLLLFGPITALFVAGVVQCRKPAAIDVTVKDDRIVAAFSRWDGIWAMRRGLTVPLTQVVDVEAVDSEDVPRRGMRFPGTSWPGVIRAGSYGTGEQRELWNVRKAVRLLVIDLDPPVPYARVVLEVADPDRVAEDVARAAAAARPNPT
jgi:hypothetical protein